MSVTPYVNTYVDQSTPQPDLARRQIYDNDDVNKNGVPKSLRRFNDARSFDRTKLPEFFATQPSPHAVTGALGTPDYLRNRGWILPSDETIRRALANIPQSVTKSLIAQSPDSPMSRLLGGRFQSRLTEKKVLEPHGFGFGVEIPKRKMIIPEPTRRRSKELWEPRLVRRLDLTKRLNQEMCAVLERHRHHLMERSRKVRVTTETAQTNVRLRALDIETVGEKVKRKSLDNASKALGLPLKIENPEALLEKLGVTRKRLSLEKPKHERDSLSKAQRPSSAPAQAEQRKVAKAKRLLSHQYKSISIVKEFTVIGSAIVEKEFEVIGSRSLAEVSAVVRAGVGSSSSDGCPTEESECSCPMASRSSTDNCPESPLVTDTWESDNCPEGFSDNGPEASSDNCPVVSSDNCPVVSSDNCPVVSSDNCPEGSSDNCPENSSDNCPDISSRSCSCPMPDEPSPTPKAQPLPLNGMSSSNLDSHTFISGEDLVSDMPSDVSSIRAYVEASGMYSGDKERAAVSGGPGDRSEVEARRASDPKPEEAQDGQSQAD